jgi:hypothetical protein
MQAAIKAGVRVYAAYASTFVPHAPDSFLKHLTQETGGEVFALHGDKDTPTVAAGIDEELRNLLALTYARKADQGNQFRHIDIKCERKGVGISAPKSIYLHN